MRILLTWALVLASCISAYADDEFPPEVRGFWGGDQACYILTRSLPLEFPEDLQWRQQWRQQWLKITATDILGTTQGRLLRKVRARVLSRGPAKLSVEFQRADDFGLIGRLDFYDRQVIETMAGSREERYYPRCEQ